MKISEETVLKVLFWFWISCSFCLLIMVVDEQLSIYVTAYDRIIPKGILIIGQPLDVLFILVFILGFVFWVAGNIDDWLD